MKLDDREKRIFEQAERVYAEFKVHNTSPGRWTYKKDGTGTYRVHITELPDDNLAITGDIGNLLFNQYRGLHWYRQQVSELLKGEGRASWGYIAEKLGYNRDYIYDFDRSEYDAMKEEAERIVAAFKTYEEVNKAQDKKIHDYPAEDDDEFDPDEYLSIYEAANKAKEEAEDAWDKVSNEKSSYFYDEEEAQKHVDWHEEHSSYEEPGCEDSAVWQRWVYENDYRGGEAEDVPSFKKMGTQFLFQNYAMAHFFRAAPSGAGGYIKGSLAEGRFKAAKRLEDGRKTKRQRNNPTKKRPRKNKR